MRSPRRDMGLQNSSCHVVHFERVGERERERERERQTDRQTERGVLEEGRGGEIEYVTVSGYWKFWERILTIGWIFHEVATRRVFVIISKLMQYWIYILYIPYEYYHNKYEQWKTYFMYGDGGSCRMWGLFREGMCTSHSWHWKIIYNLTLWNSDLLKSNPKFWPSDQDCYLSGTR